MSDRDSGTFSPFVRIALDESWCARDFQGDVQATLGAAPEALVGTRLEEWISPRDRRGLIELDRQRARYRGGLIDVVLHLECGDHERLVRLRASQAAEGAWTAWLEDILATDGDVFHRMMTDTERKARVVSTSDEGVVVLDAEGAIEEINQAALDLLAVRSDGVLMAEEAIVGKPLLELLPLGTFSSLAAAFVRARARKRFRHVETYSHEGRLLDSRLTAVHSPVLGFTGAVLTVRDVTVYREIERVSAELRATNADLQTIFSNLDLGILTVREGLVIDRQCSARLPELLRRRDIADRNMIEVVFQNSDLGCDELARLKAALDLVFGEPLFVFEMNGGCFPSAFRIEFDDGPRAMEADWVAIEDAEGCVARVMLVLRDVTELLRLRAERQAQEDQLRAIGQLLRMPPGEFSQFAESCCGALALVRASAITRPGSDEKLALARSLHTLKGNARAFGLDAVCDALHAVEDVFLATDRDPSELQRRADSALETVEEYDAINRDKLGRGGEAGPAGADEAQVLDEVLRVLDDAPSDLPTGVRNAALAVAHRPLGSVIERRLAELRSLARASGKSEPEIQWPDDVRVRRQHVRALEGILGHLLTNAVDHGIEPDEERAANGKSRRGHIEIAAKTHGETTTLTVSDDGRGLAVQRLLPDVPPRARTSDALQERIFAAGVSTAAVVTRASGRGIGMNAVRAEVERLGGQVVLRLKAAPADLTHVPFAFEIELPRRVCACDRQSDRQVPMTGS